MTDYKMMVGFNPLKEPERPKHFSELKDQQLLTKIFRVLKQVFPLVQEIELKHISNLIKEELINDLK
jgi:hypothetical protein